MGKTPSQAGVLSRLPLQMLSMKFSSHLAALARLFFTLGAFRLWQLTDLWHININYAVQPRGEGGRKGCAGCWRCGCCGCLYLLAAINDDDATKSALNTHYVGGSRSPSLSAPFATPPALLAVCTIALPSTHTPSAPTPPLDIKWSRIVAFKLARSSIKCFSRQGAWHGRGCG